MQIADSLKKNPDAGQDWRQEKGMTEDEMVGWHHWPDGHEFEQAPEDGERQGSLVCWVSIHKSWNRCKVYFRDRAEQQVGQQLEKACLV